MRICDDDEDNNRTHLLLLLQWMHCIKVKDDKMSKTVNDCGDST